jgi:DNA-binding XRE family transcriptional regulator
MLKFNKDIDTLYIHFQTGTSNIQVPTDNDDLYKFVLKSDRTQIIGYEVENATTNSSLILDQLSLNSKQKLAIVLYMAREKHGKTQKEFADMLKVSESTYKNLEKAEHNIAFDTITEIYSNLPKESSLNKVFMAAG